MHLPKILAATLLFSMSLTACGQSQTGTSDDPSSVIRVGIIGVDTSHAAAFTKLLNDPDAPPELSGCRVVVACPKNSLDIPSSVASGKKGIKQMREMGIELVDSIDELLTRVDAVLLETNDGRVHLEFAVPVLKSGKAVFIDKPVAASLADTVAIYELAERFKTPMFSSSSLRYTDGVKSILAGSAGDVVGCDTYSPCPIEETHPDLFWYGIHGVEPLFTLMGTGCESVVRASTPNTDLVVGTWKGGRIGTFRGRRKENNQSVSGYGGVAFGSKSIQPLGEFSGYKPLLVEIVQFFKTRQPPVSAEETIEIYTFMQAADESKRSEGSVVKLDDVLNKATQEAARRIAALDL